MIRLGLAALLLVTAAPVWAQNDPLAPVPETEVDPADAVPAEPDATAPSSAPTTSVPVARPVVVPRDWRGVFAAIRAGDWASASAATTFLPTLRSATTRAAGTVRPSQTPGRPSG